MKTVEEIKSMDDKTLIGEILKTNDSQAIGSYSDRLVNEAVDRMCRRFEAPTDQPVTLESKTDVTFIGVTGEDIPKNVECRIRIETPSGKVIITPIEPEGDD